MKLTIKKLSCMALLVAMTMMQTSCDELLGETDNPAHDDDPAKIAVTAVTLDETTLEMAYGNGKEVTLEATVSPADIEDFDVTWSSSDESVATVDDAGVVHAVGTGTAVITAKAGSKKATCDVSVVVNLETPLTFEAAVDGATVKLKEVFSDVVPNVEYSLDGGITWKDDLTAAGVTLAAAGDKISFRGTNEAYGSEFLHDCRQFFLSAETYVYGNVMSLINKDNYPTNKTLTAGYAFMGLFNGQNMLKNKDADHHIFLPATTLTEDCYYCMFSNCNNLTAAPELPATVMKKECYYGMFTACKNLTTAPEELPAETLAEHCYDSMFEGCENLTTAPKLPATTMKKACYSSMFNGCKNLTTAPELPATILAEHCYDSMFEDCESLTTAPELPAETLAERCYSSMFQGCKKLSSVTCKATDLSAGWCLAHWLVDAGTDESVTTKTIYINSAYSDYIAAMNSSLEGTANNAQINANVPWIKGNKGIPAGWTIAAAAE
ncbi:Ig domain-containing protein [Prevotella sp. khp7]|uniref:Ig-like domain-containing protein n=1 Tax=Prevotella sp. khp7 TaxID=1761885 RepID=UPI000A5DAA0C|nr:Ig-like domain-containing protein [Prevotella sp. khp7]